MHRTEERDEYCSGCLSYNINSSTISNCIIQEPYYKMCPCTTCIVKPTCDTWCYLFTDFTKNLRNKIDNEKDI